MFNSLYANKLVSSLLKVGAYLGRSLRENVELFSIDGILNEVSYLTQSKKIISGKYRLDKELKLTNITVRDADDIVNEDKVSGKVKSNITSFIENIYENKYKQAENSFTDILSLWEQKLKARRLLDRLNLKLSKFSKNQNILETKEFQNIKEIENELKVFVKDNKDKIGANQDILNGLKLSDKVSKAFNTPKVTIDEVVKAKTYKVPVEPNQSVYEMICMQELVKRELLETKDNFDLIWAANDKIRALADHIVTEDRSIVENTLSQAIAEIPYLALTTKKQLTDIIAHNVNSDITNSKDVQKYVSTIFELKKPVKETLIKILNQKYGVNFQNLKEPLSYKSLINTQINLLESFRKMLPKDSVIKKTIGALAESLKSKHGVEGIDVNDFLVEIFSEVIDKKALNENILSKYLDFNKIADELGSVGDILRLIQQHTMGMGQPGMGGGMPGMGQPMGQPGMGGGMPQPGMGQPPMGGAAPGPMSGEMPTDRPPAMNLSGDQEEMYPSDETLGQGDDMDPQGGMSPEEAAMGAMGQEGEPDGDEMGMGGMEGENGDFNPFEDDESGMGGENLSLDSEDLLMQLNKMSQMLDMIRSEISGGSADGMEEEDGFSPDEMSGDFTGGEGMGDEELGDEEDGEFGGGEGEEGETGPDVDDDGDEDTPDDEDDISPEEEEAIMVGKKKKGKK